MYKVLTLKTLILFIPQIHQFLEKIKALYGDVMFKTRIKYNGGAALALNICPLMSKFMLISDCFGHKSLLSIRLLSSG